MPLTEYLLDLYNRPVDHFAALVRRGEEVGDAGKLLRLDAAYQRGSVWTIEQKRNLIRSVLEGIPLGAIYLNYREGHPHQAWVVDGKQRIEALVGFERGEFGIPAEWLTEQQLGRAAEPGETVTFDQTSRGFQTTWGMTRTVAVYQSQLPDEAAERNLFERVNFGGSPMVGA
jgi:hypothetical protein